MPKHYCLDPHDPYAEREVLVEYEPTAAGLRLIAAIDDCDEDILPDLIDAERDDLRRELAADCQISFGTRHTGRLRDALPLVH